MTAWRPHTGAGGVLGTGPRGQPDGDSPRRAACAKVPPQARPSVAGRTRLLSGTMLPMGGGGGPRAVVCDF